MGCSSWISQAVKDSWMLSWAASRDPDLQSRLLQNSQKTLTTKNNDVVTGGGNSEHPVEREFAADQYFNPVNSQCTS